jgi:hypothetical protein
VFAAWSFNNRAGPVRRFREWDLAAPSNQQMLMLLADVVSHSYSVLNPYEPGTIFEAPSLD